MPVTERRTARSVPLRTARRPDPGRPRGRSPAPPRSARAAARRPAQTRSTAPVMPTAPTGMRRRSWIGAATEATPSQVSSTSAAQPRARVRSSTRLERRRGRCTVRAVNGLAARASSGLAVRHRVVRRQHLAQGGGVQRLHRADLQHLAAVVGPEDVVHDQHALLVQHAQVDALAAGAGQVVRPHQGAGPQLVHVQVAVAQAQQLGAQLVAARRRRPARRSPPAGGCAGCRARCPWPGPARRRCPTGRAGARRPPAAAASRPPARATGCSVPSPYCLRPLRPPLATSLPPFGNAEHYRSMPTSRPAIGDDPFATHSSERRRPAHACRPPRGTPLTARARCPATLTACACRARRTSRTAQSRQPSHPREHLPWPRCR